MEEWKTLRIRLAEEQAKYVYRALINPSENRARTRTAKERHLLRLQELQGPDDIPAADDQSVYKRFN